MTGWATVLCGFGSVAAGVINDKRMARHIKYQAHAQVLRDHPAFDWQAVIDPDDSAREAAKSWGVPIVVESPDQLPESFLPEIAVLTTKPGPRLEIIEALPGLKGVVVEKPLGETLDAAKAFVDAVMSRQLVCQVNLFRRTDRTYRELINAPLAMYVGNVQAGTVLYGNGLLNNGIHMIDLVRLLVGEIVSVRALAPARTPTNTIIDGDSDITAALTLISGATVTLHPIDFAAHRDVLLDLWGTEGRIEIFQEGLRVRYSPKRVHRAVDGAMEIAIDDPMDLTSYCGTAYYQLYDDMADALDKGREPLSSISNALQSEAVVHAIRRSAAADGIVIKPDLTSAS